MLQKILKEKITAKGYAAYLKDMSEKNNKIAMKIATMEAVLKSYAWRIGICASIISPFSYFSRLAKLTINFIFPRTKSNSSKALVVSGKKTFPQKCKELMVSKATPILGLLCFGIEFIFSRSIGFINIVFVNNSKKYLDQLIFNVSKRIVAIDKKYQARYLLPTLEFANGFLLLCIFDFVTTFLNIFPDSQFSYFIQACAYCLANFSPGIFNYILYKLKKYPKVNAFFRSERGKASEKLISYILPNVVYSSITIISKLVPSNDFRRSSSSSQDQSSDYCQS